MTGGNNVTFGNATLTSTTAGDVISGSGSITINMSSGTAT